MKEHAKVSTVVNKSYIRTPKPDEQIKVEPNIAMVKDLLERIKRTSEHWEIDEGKESGIKLKFDCVKSFMNTNAFEKFSTKYGLDSEIVSFFCESFATHVDLPKEKQFKY